MINSELPIHETVVKIPLNLIKIKSDRYRKDMGNLEALAESIKEQGQIQPIIVATDYTLIAGERRFQAHQLLKMETINAIIRSHDEISARITEILENLERKDFAWQEEVKAKEDLHKAYSVINPKWSERKTAKAVGLSSGGLNTDLNLAEALDMDPEMFKHCATKKSALKALQKYELDEAIAEIKLRETKTNYGKSAQKYIFNGNCLNLIDDLPAGVINSIISDPIYGIDLNKVKKQKRDTNLELDIYEDDPLEYFDLMTDLINKFPRVLNPNASILLFCRVENFKFLYDKLAEVGIKCDPIPGIWYRGIGQTNQPNTLMARSYENFIYGFRGEATLVRPGLSNILQYSGVSHHYKEHEVQKPLALMEELISRFCLPGDTILDFMCGSFTTGIAAIKKGCKPIGFELEKNKYNVAVSRLANALNAKDAGKLALIIDEK